MTTEKLSITFTLNGIREYVTGDQVPSTCRSLFIISTTKLVVPRIFLSKRIILSCFYLLIFYFEKFSTEFNVCLLPGYVKLYSLFRLKPVVEWRRLPSFPAKMTLVHALLSIACRRSRACLEILGWKSSSTTWSGIVSPWSLGRKNGFN